MRTVANVSYLRTPDRGRAPARSSIGRTTAPDRRRRRGPYIAGAVLLVVVGVLVAAGIVVRGSKASLTAAPSALASIHMPIGGGTVERVTVLRGRDRRAIPVKLSGDPVILPTVTVPADTRYRIKVVVRRPGYLAWLTGRTQMLTRTVTTPSSRLRSQYVTLGHGDTLRVRFAHPVRVVAYGPRGHLTRHVLTSPRRSVTLPHHGTAGTTFVSGQVQRWESSSAQAVSWFPAGSHATAVARPAPGTQITSATPITLTFSTPVVKALGSHLPTVTPAGAGTWHRLSSHAIVFRPTGYGYGLDQKVSIGLPSGVRLAGGQQTGSASAGTWTVPGGSTVRLQQILASLGYLPLTFQYAGAGPGATMADQEAAAVTPPKGTFGWRWSSTPAALKDQWQAGSLGTMTKGAVMMFEDQHGLTTDGVAGPDVWKALITAMVKHETNSFGYTFVQVSEGSPESLQLWHDGDTKLSGIAVNTGVPGADTATGTYPVFEHIPVTTMSGTNVDGSHYVDPGIKWVSYFNGGDALHYYPRGSYGFPQSNGCVEMDDSDAAAVYPYTPIGTLVDVS
jgi:peptidoglycan hydrolase-like protein with peptidoglycan-binding domain